MSISILTEKPVDAHLSVLLGKPSKVIKDQSEGISTKKSVHFNKDIIVEKMKVFLDIVTYFNALEKNPHGIDSSRTAYHWIIQQFADDIYSSLGLHKLEWEFDFLSKIQDKKRMKEIDSDLILLNEKVDTFLEKLKQKPQGEPIDLDEELPRKNENGKAKNVICTKNPVTIKAIGKQRKYALNDIPTEYFYTNEHKINIPNLQDSLVKIMQKKKDESKKTVTKKVRSSKKRRNTKNV